MAETATKVTMSLEAAIEGRRSVRRFRDAAVPQEDLVRVIRAATLAPSGANLQPWHFVVVRSRETLRGLAAAMEEMTAELSQRPEYAGNNDIMAKVKPGRNAEIIASAPVLIAVLMLPDAPPLPGTQQEFRCEPMVQSIGAAIEHLLLEAHALGYGAVWMTKPLYAGPKLEKVLTVGEPWKLAALIPLGVPAEAPEARPRRPLEENITFLD